MTLVIRDSHSPQKVAQSVVFNSNIVDLDTFSKFAANDCGHSGQPCETSFGKSVTIRNNHSEQSGTTRDNHSGQNGAGTIVQNLVSIASYKRLGPIMQPMLARALLEIITSLEE